VVGAATLLVEKKFIHECGQVGRVEDVVVSVRISVAIGPLVPVLRHENDTGISRILAFKHSEPVLESVPDAIFQNVWILIQSGSEHSD
jgi:hypothetical protein